MKALDFETRLKQAAAVAAPRRSVVDDVMRQLSPTAPEVVRLRWRRPAFAAGFAAAAGIAAVFAVIFFVTGTAVRLTLGDVQTAVIQQRWVHIRHDAGQIREQWINLQTGESYSTLFDGDAVYFNNQTNVRLWYEKNGDVIDQDAGTIYIGGGPPPWKPQTAWEQFVAPFAQAAAATQPTGSSTPSVVRMADTLDGMSVIRFDGYSTDSLGQRFLLEQLWADPRTHLPVRSKTRLQLADREESGKEWSTGDYDFPSTGPTDLFALGVPRGTPIAKTATTAPADVQPVLDAINRNHDNFLKNYRAVLVKVNPQSVEPVDNIDIVWRDGEKVRQDAHLPPVELQSQPEPPLPIKDLTGDALVAWGSQHEPIAKELLDSEHEYFWYYGKGKGSKPQVHVTFHRGFTLLNIDAWPEAIQWPTCNCGVGFQLLDANADTPDGCIGLRLAGEGNYRADYYVDPKNDYVCIKRIEWDKRDEKWAKARQWTLSDLRRLAGHVVAGTQKFHDFGEPAKHFSPNTSITTIDIVLMTPSDYPQGIFDPASLTTGADVVGY